jgi:hypothetical protein
MALNLTAPFALTRALVPGMVRIGWGRVINIASTAALKGYAYTAAYAATKAGLVGLTRALAVELAAKRVTVNAVCPGFTDTDIVTRAAENIQTATGRSVDEARATLARFSPQQRLRSPEEVAALVAYLAPRPPTASPGKPWRSTAARRPETCPEGLQALTSGGPDPRPPARSQPFLIAEPPSQPFLTFSAMISSAILLRLREASGATRTSRCSGSLRPAE